MPSYAPGSFTKNLGWNLSPPGLHKLYEVIKAGFGGVARPVTRDHFRRHCGLTDPNIQLIPVNFFLHNTINNKTNYVTVDELVRHAINNPHSRRFDQLALFSLHLSRMGCRLGVSGDARGAAFTNDYVRSCLWHNGGWETSRLSEDEVESAFTATVTANGNDTVHKCVTNYLYILEMVGLRGQRTSFINTHLDEWIGPGLFLAFDRYSIDRTDTVALTRTELLEMTKAGEFHKLMGTTQAYLDQAASFFADEYLALGAFERINAPAVVSGSGATLASSPATSPKAPQNSKSTASTTWSDEDAEDAALVLRRRQETETQIRNAQHVRELKALYQNACLFCGKQTVVGVDPDKHYSEAAHVKPVGQPHNGSDRKDNMITLCPEHHLQFDRGVLSLRKAKAGFTLVSKISGDPLNGTTLRLRSPHALDEENVAWHRRFWKS